MSDAPNFRFYRHPRFSVNQVADYIAAETASQRDGVIRSAKFPRKAAVIPYQQSKRVICGFLASNSGDPAFLDDDIRRLESRLRREPDGWMKDEIKRNISAIEAFKIAFTKTRAKRFKFDPGPIDLTMPIQGVRINARLDMGISETDRAGVSYAGGIVMLIANTDAARRKLDERMKTVSALVFWALQETNKNIEPLERLCLSFDVFGGEAISAPKAIERLRANVVTSCAEAHLKWGTIGPPAGYDGPDWT